MAPAQVGGNGRKAFSIDKELKKNLEKLFEQSLCQPYLGTRSYPESLEISNVQDFEAVDSLCTGSCFLN